MTSIQRYIPTAGRHADPLPAELNQMHRMRAFARPKPWPLTAQGVGNRVKRTAPLLRRAPGGGERTGVIVASSVAAVWISSGDLSEQYYTDTGPRWRLTYKCRA